MAVVRREVSDRTVVGKIFKWLFILFNLFMLLIMAVSCSASGEAIQNASNEAEYADAATAGATIGAGLATGMLLFVWLAGAVILGLFVLLTRRKKTIEASE
jgi:beta-lactamase regulating signal transducer with metallopeptidase domain